MSSLSLSNCTITNDTSNFLANSNLLTPNEVKNDIHTVSQQELHSNTPSYESPRFSNCISNNSTCYMPNCGEKSFELKNDIEQEETNAKPSEKEELSPSHHARRPPNAFLIFCKKHRPVVRQKYPSLENRGVTKILGEWWALLNTSEKQPYSDLAKEYKDAFLSANPDFRWYKLPAPPLRSLTTRPIVCKASSPTLRPPETTFISEFTPGKLADESQLGGLTSLMYNFNCTPKTDTLKLEDNNNITSKSPSSADPPPKPIKKRIFDHFVGNNNCSRNLFDPAKEQETTQQNIFENHQGDDFKANKKSERVCKGKRYEMFMLEGKLLGNKRDHKLSRHKPNKGEIKLENEYNTPCKTETPKLDLEDTIKRLAERTNIKIDFDNDKKDADEQNDKASSADANLKDFSESNFNLNQRIFSLPSLNYDEFILRKRESKKRKIKSRDSTDSKGAMQMSTDESSSNLVGSKKRKNKKSITHLNKDVSEPQIDLIGLETLAMVAASTEKISE